MNNENVIFRFLEYDYSNIDDMYTNARYLTGLTMKVQFDRFLKFVKSAVGLEIEIRHNRYTIEEIALRYDGGDEDAFCVNIYCCGV